VRQRQPHRARASSQSSGRNVTESSAFFDRELRAPLELFLDRQARYGCNSAPPSFAETGWPTRVTSPSACVPPRPARPSLAATAFRRPFVYADLCESIHEHHAASREVRRPPPECLGVDEGAGDPQLKSQERHHLERGVMGCAVMVFGNLCPDALTCRPGSLTSQPAWWSCRQSRDARVSPRRAHASDAYSGSLGLWRRHGCPWFRRGQPCAGVLYQTFDRDQVLTGPMEPQRRRKAQAGRAPVTVLR
jgi:hypothetical protein